MPKALRVKTMTDVHERKPLLVFRGDVGDDQPYILHIVRREGKRPYEKHDENVTNCSRVMTFSHRYSQGGLPLPENTIWKLCARCGTREDFQAALDEYWEWRREADEKYKLEEQQRREQAEKAWKEYLADLQFLHTTLLTAGIDASYDKDDRLIIQFNGRTFDVTEAR